MVIVKPFLTYYIRNCMLLHLLPYHLITPVLHLITVMYYHVITLVITCYLGMHRTQRSVWNSAELWAF